MYPNKKDLTTTIHCVSFRETLKQKWNEFQGCTEQSAANPHLMLIAQVSLQVTQLSAVEVTKPTLVGPDAIVLCHVHTQVFIAATCESAFMTTEDNALKVTRQLWATRLYRDDTLLWREKTQEPWDRLKASADRDVEVCRVCDSPRCKTMWSIM